MTQLHIIWLLLDFYINTTYETGPSVHGGLLNCDLLLCVSHDSGEGKGNIGVRDIDLVYLFFLIDFLKSSFKVFFSSIFYLN